ncbi:MAG: class I SAM-dependent methyltransferase, partial [Acidimicrobiales bacterium]
VDGVAESLPLADASVDLAVVSSAWHWFAQPAATDEFARVLSDGGRIFVLGNGFAERHQWFEDIAQTPDPTAVTAGARHSRESGEDLGRRFVDVESFSIEWAWWRTHDELMGMFSTYSGYITATPDEREALDRIAVEGLARVLPTGEGDVAMNLHGVHAVRPPRGRGA